jgi:hypothetical protein
VLYPFLELHQLDMELVQFFFEFLSIEFHNILFRELIEQRPGLPFG